MPAIPDWARAYDAPVISGVLRRSPTDFQVTELLDYELSGEGEHDFLWLEKQGANTAWVAGALARHAGVRESDVGFAGLKDRNAITRQWFSIRRPSAAGTDWKAFELPGVTILKQTQHGRKLRRGAHSGNRFRITVAGVDGDSEQLEQRLCTIRDKGVPNYFGEQRFGRDGGNLKLATDLFAGKKTRRNKRSIALSAARSWLFNHILQRRIENETWNRLLAGDSACLDGSNSLFAVTEVDATLRRRCEELDIHPGGALWGGGAFSCEGEVLALEQSVVEPFEELRLGLEAHTRQSRRALRMAVIDLNWDINGQDVQLEFTLTSGAFATAVLREIVKY
jgi:tRNA pseudouridine13 synthase